MATITWWTCCKVGCPYVSWALTGALSNCVWGAADNSLLWEAQALLWRGDGARWHGARSLVCLADRLWWLFCSQTLVLALTYMYLPLNAAMGVAVSHLTSLWSCSFFPQTCRCSWEGYLETFFWRWYLPDLEQSGTLAKSWYFWGPLLTYSDPQFPTCPSISNDRNVLYTYVLI